MIFHHVEGVLDEDYGAILRFIISQKDFFRFADELSVEIAQGTFRHPEIHIMPFPNLVVFLCAIETEQID